jgi:hypothetical protein
MIARAIRLLLASGFLAAVAHAAPVAERAALGITRVEDLAPEAIARPLGEIRVAGTGQGLLLGGAARRRVTGLLPDDGGEENGQGNRESSSRIGADANAIMRARAT